MPCIAARKPSAIDSTAENTMTTPAMPTIATTEEPRRCGIDRRLTLVTAMSATASSCRTSYQFAGPQRIDDLAAGCACIAGSSAGADAEHERPATAPRTRSRGGK